MRNKISSPTVSDSKSVAKHFSYRVSEQET